MTFVAVEKNDRSGGQMVATEDVPNLSAIGFTPSIFVLSGNVGGHSGGALVMTLQPGGYATSTLKEKGVDKLEVPEGLIVRFASGDADPNAKSFKKGDITVDETLLKFSDVYIIVSWNSSELSDDELAMVAGGKEACGAAVCAADMCDIEACPAMVCAVNVVPGMPVSI